MCTVMDVAKAGHIGSSAASNNQLQQLELTIVLNKLSPLKFMHEKSGQHRVYPGRLSREESRFSCFAHDEPGQQSSVPIPSVSWVIKIFLFYTWRARLALACTHAGCLSENQNFPVLHMTSQVSTRVYPMPAVCRKIKIFLFYTWHTATSSLPRPTMQVM